MKSSIPTVCVVVGVLGAFGCPADDAPGPTGDAGPKVLQFVPFTSKTWSLSNQSGAVQLSISDVAAPTACPLATSQANGLSVAGVQIIARLPDDNTEVCPVGHYSLDPEACTTNLGSAPLIGKGCAYYRAWDASGTLLGVTAALNGEMTVSGSAASCNLRANIGFLGGSFAEIYTLETNPGTDPWCQDAE